MREHRACDAERVETSAGTGLRATGVADSVCGMSPSFDAASGLPLGPEARRALDAAIDHGWADPARLHRDGRVARQLLDAARAAVATCIGALPQEVVFTASGTDALHAGLLGLARGRRTVGTTVVASAVEHSAVLRAADWVSSGEDPVLVPVNPHAEVEVKALRRAVRSPGVALAAVQHVNHEIGAVQPLDQVHAATREAGVPLLVDACAALGSLPVTPHWDALAGSAHKWGGPAGVGILAVRTGVRWRSPMPTDEAGRWAGFPNVPGAVAAATALEAATAQLGSTSARRARLLATLRERVPSLAPDVLAGSAHKWGGPAGVGILAVRTGVRWRSPMPTDEAGRWAGFPNVPGAVAAATALEAATAQLGSTSARRAHLLTALRERVPHLAPDVLALGRPDSAPHIVCFTILYADGEVLVTELDRAGFAVSSGSACTADTRRPSHVLAAMGAVTHGNLRVSLPPEATHADVSGFLDALPAAIAAARAAADRGSA